jgi:hypothetical protein
MNFLPAYAKRVDVPLAIHWTDRDDSDWNWRSVTIVGDEFEVSPVDIVQAFLRSHASFSAHSNVAAQWERLFAIGQIIERTHQSRFEIEVFGELLVARAIDFDPIPVIQYSTKSLASYPPAEEEYQIPIAVERSPSIGFVPSKSLTDIWIKSISALAHEAGETAVGRLSANYAAEDIRQRFSSTLTSTLGTLAQQLRYERAAGEITRNGEFISRMQIEICDAFLILPSMSTEFLGLLKAELIKAIRNGWEFRGAWGHLEMTSAGEVAYRLNQPEFATTPGFVRARRVE